MTEWKTQYSSVSVVPRTVRQEYRDAIQITTATPVPGNPLSHPLDIDGSFLGVNWRWGVAPTICLHLILNLIMRGAIPPLDDVFMVRILSVGTMLPYPYCRHS
jgi:hypothetical protein